LYLEFSKEEKNLRLDLVADEMNPYGSLSTQHNSWPILLVIYNLLPWLCMKRKYMMLYMMISGPRQPRNDIDVYLNPLIEDSTKFWDEGLLCLMGIEMKHSSCVQFYFVPLMTFQHTGI